MITPSHLYTNPLLLHFHSLFIMNNLFKLLTLLTLLVGLSLSSCRKDTPVSDPCDNINCFNGGVCTGGLCDCPPGFSGSRCQDADPCYNITCLNGGNCINGVCDCPPGFSGAACQTALTPTSMTITRVVVENYPTLNSNGGGWDVSSGADAYLAIARGRTSVNYQSQPHYEHPNYYGDVTGQELTFTLSTPYTITELNTDWIVMLRDYDTPDPDDHMAGVYYTPMDMTYSSSSPSGRVFPASYILNTSRIRARVFVTWNF